MFGNQSQGGGGDSAFVRLSGMFNTKKGGLIGRVEPSGFNAIFAMMTEADKIGGTLNFIVSKNKKTGMPELYAVVGQPYQNQKQAATLQGPFGFTQRANVLTGAVKEVKFGVAEVPKDDVDSLLENL